MATDILKVIGLLLDFIGVIFLSAGLLKSKRQIRDEEATYWGSNPFKTSGELKRMVFYRVGFYLLIAGFALQIATTITFYPFCAVFLCQLLVSACITISGWYLLVLFMNRNERKHEEYAEEHWRSVCIRVVKSRMDEINDKFDKLCEQDATYFKRWKENTLKNIDDGRNRLNEELAEAMQDYFKKVKDADNSERLRKALLELIEMVESYKVKC